MTLSHCWGQLQLTTLTKSNIAIFEAGLEISKLPKTFRDAIHVTRRMSIQYLWIDSLCIIQDSKEDWKRESALMMSVYAGAHCNIAACGAADARTGLFFDRSTAIPRSIALEIPEPPISLFYQSLAVNHYSKLKAMAVRWFRSKDDQARAKLYDFWSNLNHVPFFKPGKYSCQEFEPWRSDILESPLQKRAWVLQETILAKRTLHFTSTQLYFGCKEHVIAEIFSSGTFSRHDLGRGLLPNSTHTKRGDEACDTSQRFSSSTSHSSISSRGLGRWLDIIEIYTGLDLTYETDRQVAIAGVAR